MASDTDQEMDYQDPMSLRDLVNSKTPQITDIMRSDGADAMLKFLERSMYWSLENATILSVREISLIKKLFIRLDFNRKADNEIKRRRNGDKKEIAADHFEDMIRMTVNKGLNLNVSKEGKGREQAVRFVTGNSNQVEKRWRFFGRRNK